MHLSERAAAPPGEVRSCGASNAALSDFEADLAVRLLLNLLQQMIQALGVSNDAGLRGFLRRVLHLCGRFCAWPRFKRELMRGRIVGQLQPVLAARHPPICHLHALQILTDLTAEEDYRQWVSQDEMLQVVPPTIGLLRDGDIEQGVCEQAVRAVKNLALDDVLRDAIMRQSGVLEALVLACRADCCVVLQEQAARALGNIAMKDSNEERVVEAGAVEALTDLLRASNEGNHALKPPLAYATA